MRPGVFYMTFALDNERIVSYGFSMVPGCGDYLVRFFEDESNLDEFDDFRSNLEDYGVHDVCGHPSPEVESVAFTSYEVEEDRIPELMRKWRAYFVSMFGEDAVGPVTDIGDACEGDDLDVYMTCIGENHD